MRITFHKTYVADDQFKGTSRETKFEAGHSYDLNDRQSEHFVTNNFASYGERSDSTDAPGPQALGAGGASTPSSQNSPTVAPSRANNPAEDSVDMLTGRDEKQLAGVETDEQREQREKDEKAKAEKSSADVTSDVSASPPSATGLNTDSTLSSDRAPPREPARNPPANVATSETTLAASGTGKTSNKKG